MVYLVELTSTAARQLRKLPLAGRKRIGAAIELLKANPRPPKAKLLKGRLKNLYRVRTGDYRIIYQIQDDKLIICVVAIGDRKDIYKRR